MRVSAPLIHAIADGDMALSVLRDLLQAIAHDATDPETVRRHVAEALSVVAEGSLALRLHDPVPPA
ncbi:hypothetical protein [Pseudoroseomonas cervicalis]|uniref:hypothetical protein n=1 Tax=Teichococcus cervicalis TaxID=204525 RepID=UPI0022F1AA2E|nr:hypothetical protein [Pseudoroseomonas cervicalis]WBV44022.1 hypothetical protein PFY06_05495 [Pseudoroseomonas cervicalis]